MYDKSTGRYLYIWRSEEAAHDKDIALKFCRFLVNTDFADSTQYFTGTDNI